ncbi:MAG: hypothetical protein JKY65_24025 [Planctomycetes bacterium]|nr:hypothetical protein [Planctomycetota bacterium]
MNISFGDNVRVVRSPETAKLGLASRAGQVCGETTPSVTNVEVIGISDSDHAVNVLFDELDQSHWFALSLLEFIDHGAGTEMTIGNLRAVRRADGSWDESVVEGNPDPPPPEPRDESQRG